MIRVNRPAQPPTTLRTKGQTATAELCALFDKQPHDYHSGIVKFSFDGDVYGATDVKQALRQAQHDKCCFCESKVSHVCPGDVEHFRPKAAVREKENGPLLRPGYYWLAYEWTNLFYSCEICNRRGKKNDFPLRNSRQRARRHGDVLANEKPIFVNPVDDEPSKHLGFREEFVLSNTKRGEVTRDALQLNRDELLADRLRHLEALKVFVTTHATLLRLIREAKKSKRTPDPDAVDGVARIERLLRQWREDSGDYAAMVRTYLRSQRFRFTTTA